MTIKRILTLALALLLALPLAACGKTVAYRDDVSTAELSAAVQSLIPVEGGYDMSGEDFLKYYFDFDHRYTIDGYAIASDEMRFSEKHFIYFCFRALSSAKAMPSPQTRCASAKSPSPRTF